MVSLGVRTVGSCASDAKAGSHSDRVPQVCLFSMAGHVWRWLVDAGLGMVAISLAVAPCAPVVWVGFLFRVAADDWQPLSVVESSGNPGIHGSGFSCSGPLCFEVKVSKLGS